MKKHLLTFLMIAVFPSFLMGQVQKDTPKYRQAREKMVLSQIRLRGISDKKVLKAMSEVLRHSFVPEELASQAYADHPLPIGEGQTISQPYIVALMTESLKLKGPERVLEIGTGSGYQAAVAARLAAHVYTMEIQPPLAERASTTLAGLGYENVTVRQGDGYYGWEEHAPFDAIEGLELFDKVVDIDQSPIGRTPRSNPATYTGLFTPIRDLFAAGHPRDLLDAVGALDAQQACRGAPLHVAFLDPEVCTRVRGDLREMGDAEDLMPARKFSQAAPHPVGGPAADAGVDLVEDQHHARIGLANRGFDREEGSRELAARRRPAQRQQFSARAG